MFPRCTGGEDGAVTVNNPSTPARLPSLQPRGAQGTVTPKERIISEIPTSQFARIRAWVKYEMSVAQVVGIYGVAVDVIERILRQT
jgi:hypothetical protein